MLDMKKGGLGDFASPPFGLIADGIFFNGLVNIEFTIINVYCTKPKGA